MQGSAVGRYVVFGQLGAGGVGAVYAAYDPELDRKVAVKLPELGGSNSQLAMLTVSLSSPSCAPPALLRRSAWPQGAPGTASVAKIPA